MRLLTGCKDLVLHLILANIYSQGNPRLQSACRVQWATRPKWLKQQEPRFFPDLLLLIADRDVFEVMKNIALLIPFFFSVDWMISLQCVVFSHFGLSQVLSGPE